MWSLYMHKQFSASNWLSVHGTHGTRSFPLVHMVQVQLYYPVHGAHGVTDRCSESEEILT